MFVLFRKLSILSCLALVLVGMRGAEPCPDAMEVTGCPCGIGEGYTIVKAYTIQLDEPAQEFTYVFTQGTEYLLTTCGPTGAAIPLKVTVLDEYHKPLFNNYQKKTKQYMQRMGYVRGQTSVSHLKLEPEAGKKGCGYLFISFRPAN